MAEVVIPVACQLLIVVGIGAPLFFIGLAIGWNAAKRKDSNHGR